MVLRAWSRVVSGANGEERFGWWDGGSAAPTPDPPPAARPYLPPVTPPVTPPEAAPDRSPPEAPPPALPAEGFPPEVPSTEMALWKAHPPVPVGEAPSLDRRRHRRPSVAAARGLAVAAVVLAVAVVATLITVLSDSPGGREPPGAAPAVPGWSDPPVTDSPGEPSPLPTPSTSDSPKAPTRPPAPTTAGPRPAPPQPPRPAPTPSRRRPPSPPTSYEAESPANRLRSGARVDTHPAASGGLMVYAIGASNLGTLEFRDVTAPAAGTYTLRIFYQNPESTTIRTAHVSVNGGPARILPFSPTGQCCIETVTMSIQLAAGSANTITFGNPDTRAPDIDIIEVAGPTG